MYSTLFSIASSVSSKISSDVIGGLQFRVSRFGFRVSGSEFRSFLSSLFNPELETRNQKRETAIHSEVTKVPTFSPQTTFLILCGLLMSKTIIGTRLSMQRLKAVESITRSLFVNASVKETVSYRCAF